FVPRLRQRFPALRILDHLYDHQVGYVERYDDPALLASIDACVAENRRISATLQAKGWPAERAPVIWPCGRRDEEWPPAEAAPEVRAAIRAELGIPAEALVVLTAARMHPQKRPLDLPALAERLAGTPFFFLVVGGGPLEREVDAAIEDARTRGATI